MSAGIRCRRDFQADSKFYYYQNYRRYRRLSCGARLARPENVRFHATCKDAESAGFRPCSAASRIGTRCSNSIRVAAACRLIENSHIVPNLEQLSKHGIEHLSLSPVFKAIAD